MKFTTMTHITSGMTMQMLDLHQTEAEWVSRALTASSIDHAILHVDDGDPRNLRWLLVNKKDRSRADWITSFVIGRLIESGYDLAARLLDPDALEAGIASLREDDS